MTLFSEEHYALMEMFERETAWRGRYDKEDKSMWSKEIIYQDDMINQIFLAYRRGYAHGLATSRNNETR